MKRAELLKLNKQATLTPKQKQGLLYFSESVKKSLKDKIVDLKLYGSRARGDAHPNSDIDVLVVLKRKSERSKNKVYDISTEALQKYDTLLSVHIMSEKSYNFERELPSLFMQFVENEGISL